MAILTFLTTVLNLLTKHPYKVIIAVLVIIIILQRTCSPSAETIETHTTDTITTVRVDTVTLLDTSYIPTIRYRVKYDTVIDTVVVLQEYFTKNYYTDTILDSSKGFIVIADVVFKNKIIERTPTIKLYPETVTHTKTISVITPPKAKVFVGFGLMYSAGNNPSMSANIALVTKKDFLVGFGFDPFTKTADVRVYWKLKFRR